MEDTEVSREEIVKKFDLPERKTKLETILKMQKEPIYCICQSTDISRFMICCEKCDEWYHGDCIGLAEKDSKYIKKWYCSECIKSYGLQVVYFPMVKKSNKKKKNQKKHKMFEQGSSKFEDSRCNQCSNCLRHEECGNKDYLDIFLKKHSKHKQKRSSLTHSDEQLAIVTQNKKKKHRHKRKTLDRKHVNCIAPNCLQMARVNSKYCSDECGLALAKLRIISILPNRVFERSEIPCVADQLDQAKLVNVRLQKKIAVEAIKKLDHKEKKLQTLISRSKRVPVVENEEEVEDESKIYCFTCGWEVPYRSVGRHMEICFKKFESQMAVVGCTKTNSEHCNIFCEYYNAADKTYCKRLRYICPDHFKPQKAKENEVCGCPIIKTVSPSIFSGAEKFCQKSKKKCDLHYNWELLSLAEIDLERFREWNKLAQLLEEEERIRNQMSNRAGALGLMLHSAEPTSFYV